jgi:hypothetical protein
MKKYILNILFTFWISSISAQVLCYERKSEPNNDLITFHSNNFISDQIVYVCNGPYAYAYHSISNCSGLNNCSAEVQYTNESYATYTMGRVPCCKCWSNTNGRCKDDNPYNSNYRGGGGGGEDGSGLLALGFAIVTLSAIILSNDISVHGITALDPMPEIYRTQANSKIGMGVGFNSSLRKTFKKSALEYGGGLINYKEEISINANNLAWDSTSNSYVNQLDPDSLSLIYNHTIPFVQFAFLKYFDFKANSNNQLQWFLGPVINLNEQSSFGLISGIQWKPLDRLKFDIRYQITNHTNRFSLGLIFNYQKKYFWQK